MEVKAGIKALKELRLNGKIATLRHARKAHKCSECGFPIPADTDYYEVVYAGSGLGGLKFPDYVHVECMGMDEGGGGG